MLAVIDAAPSNVPQRGLRSKLRAAVNRGLYALEKVTGKATYTVDVRRPGMLHAAIVRAPIAHGRVLTLDLAPALAVPGVRAVLRRGDVERLRYDSGQLFDTAIHRACKRLHARAVDRRAPGADILQVEPAIVPASDAAVLA